MLRISTNRYVLPLFLGGALLCGVTLLILLAQPNREHAVALTADGFQPSVLAIDVGDAVSFSTHTGGPFWPASNEHPSHLSFPEFDPKQPIPEDATWSFTFNTPGTYRFHDHINPHLTGVVIVRGQGDTYEEVKNTAVTFEECLDSSQIDAKVSCWSAFLEWKIRSEGVQKAFEVFGDIYRADPEYVAVGCHGAVHLMGEAAYDFYKDGGTIDFTSDMEACGYGFYHGFLGKLLHEKPDIEDAVKFCQTLRDSVSGAQGQSVFSTCFHGIGHGMVEETPLPEYYWGKADTLMDPALKACSTLPDTFQQRECADGAFNGLTRFMVNDQYGFTYDDSNPLGWCERFKEQRINYTSCNYEMSQHFATRIIINRDLGMVLPFLDGIDLEVQTIIVENAVAGLMQSDVLREDNSDYFQRCEVFQSDDLQYACLRGVVTGFFGFGEPGNEAPKAQAFCASLYATQVQHTSCAKILEDLL